MACETRMIWQMPHSKSQLSYIEAEQRRQNGSKRHVSRGQSYSWCVHAGAGRRACCGLRPAPAPAGARAPRPAPRPPRPLRRPRPASTTRRPRRADAASPHTHITLHESLHPHPTYSTVCDPQITTRRSTVIIF